MVDEAVGQPQLEHADAAACLVEHTAYFRAGAAYGGVFLEGDQQVVSGGELQDEVAVDGLDEAHVGHRRVKLFAHLQGRAEHAAEGEQRAALALATDLKIILKTIKSIQVLKEFCNFTY